MKDRKDTFHLFKNQSDPEYVGEDDNRPERRVAIVDILLDKHMKDESYTMHEIRKDLDLLLFAVSAETILRKPQSLQKSWGLFPNHL